MISLDFSWFGLQIFFSYAIGVYLVLSFLISLKFRSAHCCQSKPAVALKIAPIVRRRRSTVAAMDDADRRFACGRGRTASITAAGHVTVGITTFNRMAGGEYLFMPSLSALRWIGEAGWTSGQSDAEA